MSKRTFAIVLAAGGALSAAAMGGPFQFSAIALEGDTVSGVGVITLFNNLAVNNSGMWHVEVDTNNADTDIDGAVITGTGFGAFSLLLQEGQALAMPGGATLDSFDSISLNNNGDTSYNHFLDGTTGTSDDSGVYFNSTLVIQESTFSTASAFSPSTPYIGWFETRLNDNNQIFMLASVDDVAIPSTVDRALVVATVDGSGALVNEKVIAKEGDAFLGQALSDVATGPHGYDFNNAGQAMFVADLDGPTTGDGAVIISDGDTTTVIAQEGTASGIQGRNWGSLSSSTVVALNDNGDWAMRATLAGDTTSDTVIVSNGAVVAQEGSGHASIGSFTFTSFGTGPVDIDSAGNVLYYGDWNDANTDIDTGLFINDMLIVQEGVTMIDGVIIDTIASVQDAFAISDNGQWVIFEGTLVGGIDGVFLIRIPAPGAASALGLLGLAGLRRRR